jgi:hypothetical protein
MQHFRPLANGATEANALQESVADTWPQEQDTTTREPPSCIKGCHRGRCLLHQTQPHSDTRLARMHCDLHARKATQSSIRIYLCKTSPMMVVAALGMLRDLPHCRLRAWRPLVALQAGDTRIGMWWTIAIAGWYSGCPHKGPIRSPPRLSVQTVVAYRWARITLQHIQPSSICCFDLECLYLLHGVWCMIGMRWRRLRVMCLGCSKMCAWYRYDHMRSSIGGRGTSQRQHPTLALFRGGTPSSVVPHDMAVCCSLLVLAVAAACVCLCHCTKRNAV